MDKKYLLIILVILVSTISFLRSFLGLIGIVPWHIGYSDIFNEDRIKPATAFQIPYLEKPIEYPIITGFFIYLMWFFGKNLLGYALLSYLFLTSFAVITALFLYRLCQLLKVNDNRILQFFVFAPSLLFFSVFNWDIMAVMLMVVSIYYFHKNKYGLASFMLALGFNAKLFPAVILPFMLLKTNNKHRITIVLVFLLTFLALNLYFITSSFDMWKLTYSAHAIRNPNTDSIWHLTGLQKNIVNLLSSGLFLLFYTLLVIHHKKFDLAALGTLSISGLLALTKIFSPQYILWMLPFFVLLPYLGKWIFYGLELTNIIVFFSTTALLLLSKNLTLSLASGTFVILRFLLLCFLILFISHKFNKLAIFTKTKGI